MGIFLLLVVLAYLVFSAVVFGLTVKFVKSKKVRVIVALGLILFPARRLIFYETLFFFYSRSPLQEIRKTVEYPISVYWEDDVWPGFDEYGRHWMVKNYLDGEHLKILALNGEDGKIYLYRATVNNYAESEKILSEVERAEIAYEEALAKAKESGTGKYAPPWVESRQIRESARVLRWQHYEPQKDKDVQVIMLKVEVYEDKKNLPPMNYLVEFNNLPKTLFVNNKRKMLHADRVSIVDTKTAKEIAFSRRYMVYAGFISRFSDEQPKFTFQLGDIWAYEFDNKVLFEYTPATGEYHSSEFYRNKNYKR